MSVTRTRFAPSPTGSLHVGGARTALYCLLYARKSGGKFVLRIEDTDQARSTQSSAQGILRDLRWLGLNWDEGPEVGGEAGPYFQSERLELYAKFFERLLQTGHAYEAWESREELNLLRKTAEANKETFRYRERPLAAEDLARFQSEGRTPILRLRAPNRNITITDEVLGDVTIREEDLEDIVIRKADGFPTYHFAVVIDDHHMDTTVILRGQEHLMNTPKHLGLYEALQWSPPRFSHLPLIFSMQGSKMSKRDKAKKAREMARTVAKNEGLSGWDWLAAKTHLSPDELVRFMKKKNDEVSTAEAIATALGEDLPMIDVMDFRKAGILPEALVNYLALLGWSPGDDREIMTLQEMTQAFSLERINRTAARFDVDKLNWMNGEYIRSASLERLTAALDSFFEVADCPLKTVAPEQQQQLLALYQQRIQTLAELGQKTRFFFQAPTEWNAKAVRKHILKGDGTPRLAAAKQALTSLTDWTQAGLEDCIGTLAEEQGHGLGKYAQPLRIALAGTAVTPSIFETLALFSQDEVLNRIDALLEHLSAEA